MKVLNKQIVKETISSISKNIEAAYKSQLVIISRLNTTHDLSLLTGLQKVEDARNINLELMGLWQRLYISNDPEQWINDIAITIIERQRDVLANKSEITVKLAAELQFLEEVFKGIAYRKLLIEEVE